MLEYLALLVVAVLVFIYTLVWIYYKTEGRNKERLEAARPSQISLSIPVVNSDSRELGGGYMAKEMGFQPLY